MKKIKIIVFFLIAFLLSGCSGTYNLSINKDLTIEEELRINISGDNDNYDKVLSLFDNNNVDEEKYRVIIEEENISVTYKDSYDSVEDYLLNSKLYHQFYDKINYINEKKNASFYMNSPLMLKETDSLNVSNNFNINYFQINIKTPLKILSSNADQVQENTLSWEFNENSKEKRIELKLKLEENKIEYGQIILIGLVVLLTTSFIVVIARRFLSSKKI